MRTELTLRLGEALQVESVPIKITGMKWMTNVFATPHIDTQGRVTDLWAVTESTTGAYLPIFPMESIDAIAPAIRRWVKREKIDAHKWDRLIAKTKLFKSRILK